MQFPTDEPGADGAETFGSSPAGAFTILLVEDNRDDVFIIKEILKKEELDRGLHVVTDGDQAMKFWNRIENDPEAPCVDLVLLDLNLPRLSGLEILARIRRGSRCAAVPVVIVSSSSSPSDVAATEALGISKYFQKTTDLSAFMGLGKVIQGLLPERPGKNTGP